MGSRLWGRNLKLIYRLSQDGKALRVNIQVLPTRPPHSYRRARFFWLVPVHPSGCSAQHSRHRSGVKENLLNWMRVTGLSRDTGAAEGSALFTKAREVFLFKVSLMPSNSGKSKSQSARPLLSILYRIRQFKQFKMLLRQI